MNCKFLDLGVRLIAELRLFSEVASAKSRAKTSTLRCTCITVQPVDFHFVSKTKTFSAHLSVSTSDAQSTALKAPFTLTVPVLHARMLRQPSHSRIPHHL